jgi:hypothetical protein
VRDLPRPERELAATALADGRVLLAGGSGVMLYDPADDAWLDLPMSERRVRPTVTVLLDGRVLVAGGETMPSPIGDGRAAIAGDVFDPRTARLTPTAPMPGRRCRHAAALLPDGRVLLTGGTAEPGRLGRELASAALYDPAADRFTEAAPMRHPRAFHTAAPLPDGRVMVLGGSFSGEPRRLVAATEIYDPETDSWSEGAALPLPRAYHVVTPVGGGRLLVTGGFAETQGRTPLAGLFDPESGRWHAAGEMAIGRDSHTATLLGGAVLVVGGQRTARLLHAIEEPGAVELYDVAAGRFRIIDADVVPRMEHVAVALSDGRVLLAGGVIDHYEPPLARVELVELACR